MKKVLTLTLTFAFIAMAGFIVSGCSGDNKNKVVNGSQTTPFEGTWKTVNSGFTYIYQFTDLNFIYFDDDGYNKSYKGTFTYDGDAGTLVLSFTYQAVGNALTGDVTWTTSSYLPQTIMYSFPDGNTLKLDGFDYDKIS